MTIVVRLGQAQYLANTQIKINVSQMRWVISIQLTFNVFAICFSVESSQDILYQIRLECGSWPQMNL